MKAAEATGSGSIVASLRADYEALRESCALLDRPPVSLLTLKGEDRSRFLQGLITCDVGVLEPGQGAYGFFTDAKGHILSDVAVRAFEDRLWLELPLSNRELIAAHLEKYIVADRVEILTGDHSAVLLAGAKAPGLVENLVAAPLPAQPPWGHRAAAVAEHQVVVASEERRGVPAFTLWVAPGAVADLVAGLRELGAPLAPRPIREEALEVVRIEEGLASYGRDFGAENLPQETGIEEAVSYSKGCYLGQEVIARLHYRGQVARRICSLRFEGPGRPSEGSTLLLEDREAGTITSMTTSPCTGRVVGLAMVQRRAAEPGTTLICGEGGVAVVRDPG